MLSASWMIVLAGIVFSVILFAIIAKSRAAKPKKAERFERAQIVKQLLALSEGEDTVKGISRQQSVSQSPAPRRRPEAAKASPSRAARPA